MSTENSSPLTIPARGEIRRPRPLVAPLDFFYLGYLYPLRLLARLLPARLFLTLTRKPLVWFYLRCRRKAVSRVEKNMVVGLPDLPSGQRKACARRQVGLFASRALEDLVLDRLIRRGLDEVEIEGLEHVDRARSAGRGVLVCSAHLYPARIARRHLATLGYPMAGLRDGLPPTDRAVGRLGQRYLQPVYQEFVRRVNVEEIYIQQRGSALAMLRQLRQNKILFGFLDVKLSRELRWLPFLEGKRYFATGMLEVVRLSGCELLPMVCSGDSEGLRIRFSEPFDLQHNPDRERFLTDSLPLMAAWLETIVRERPEEWEFWAGVWERSKGAAIVRPRAAPRR